MSRHRVTYKPGGAIAKPLDLSLKMQRVTPTTPPADCLECYPCQEMLANLVAVWLGPDFAPIPENDGSLTVAVSSTSTWCESTSSCYTERTGAFLLVARMVNDDYADAGLATPMNIDESACYWGVTWSVEGNAPLIIMSGSSLAIGYHEFIGSGTLTIEPKYDGSPLPTLTLTVAATIINNCV